mgnify:CR=1 FL=1
MKIVILGAGQVGSTVAHNLSNENNDITVVDLDEARLQDLQGHLDIRVVHGFASHPKVMIRAGIEDADLVVAVTNSDEVNMIACQVAYTLYNTPTRIARIRSSDYIENPRLFEREHCPVDVLISPETLVTEYMAHLIDPSFTATMESSLDAISRTLERVRGAELERLQRALPMLATTASATPFIGLFGTVWGIMNTFRAIGATGSTSILTVAPGIAEALINTAAGLLAAIPAVIAYNHLLALVRSLNRRMEDFELEFLNLVERNFT